MIIKSFKPLRGMAWKKTDDFLPLLIMGDDKICRLRSKDPKCFTNRIYELAEVFSVSVDMPGVLYSMLKIELLGKDDIVK